MATPMGIMWYLKIGGHSRTSSAVSGKQTVVSFQYEEKRVGILKFHKNKHKWKNKAITWGLSFDSFWVYFVPKFKIMVDIKNEAS